MCVELPLEFLIEPDTLPTESEAALEADEAKLSAPQGSAAAMPTKSAQTNLIEGDASKVIAGSKVEQRVIRSRTGHMITLDDSDGDPGVKVEDRNGNVVHIKTSSDELVVTMKGNVTMDSKQNMSVKTQGNVTIEATGSLEIKGMGVTIDGGGGTVDVKGSVINLN